MVSEQPERGEERRGEEERGGEGRGGEGRGGEERRGEEERGGEERGEEGKGGEERFVILMWFPSSCSLTFVFEPSSKVFGYSAHPLEPGGASIVSVLHYGVLVCIHYCTHTTWCAHTTVNYTLLCIGSRKQIM